MYKNSNTREIRENVVHNDEKHHSMSAHK